ncbi:MAG: NAD-dependent epimerase/dehydratase family protein, partial [Wenzhouxiangella sp.]
MATPLDDSSFAALGQTPVVLVLGASGPVGQFFLKRAVQHGQIQLLAVSRRAPAFSAAGLTWLQHDLNESPVSAMAAVLVSLGPIGLALRQLEATPAIGRVIALSSASTEFKSDSADPAERALMAEICAAEARLSERCQARGVHLSLLKPTMIYGGADANVSRLSALAARLPLLPVAGRGLRQPVHADDLAELSLRLLGAGPDSAGTWLLGGGETLAYPAMLRRIAAAQAQPARIVSVPLFMLQTALRLAHALGRLRDVRPVMLERQAVDLTVNDQPAREQLGWNPRPFRP